MEKDITLLSLFDYSYPEELVAQRPLPRRDASRMMVVCRGRKESRHTHVSELPGYLKEGDLLVINDSKVFPARLMGSKLMAGTEAGHYKSSAGRHKSSAGRYKPTQDTVGSKVELLLLKEIDQHNNIWFAIATRKKRLRKGTEIHFGRELSAEIIENREDGLLVKFEADQDVHGLIDKIGLPPLPPYIKRKTAGDYTDEDRERYQTVYARHLGSAAAPTAGFHLSEKILEACRAKGVEIVPITLHVGLDTFSPVRVNNIKEHKMHGETYFISEESAATINKAKTEGRRIIAVGTTTVRALESAWQELYPGLPSQRDTRYEIRDTNLFIYPGYKFKIVDAMLTNFHQPRSTLLMLVAAFAGRKFILQTYAEAIKKQYRLFSYGDCMLII